jgi:hypothetical protein
MDEIELEVQEQIIQLWEKDCPLDILCDEVDIDPEVIAKFLRLKGFVV